MRIQKSVAFLMIICLFLLRTNIAVATEKIEVAVNQSRLLAFNGVYRVAVANPDIADVGVVSGSEILLIGKKPGLTTVHIWSGAGRDSFLVEVGTDDSNIANTIRNMLGYTNIRVSKVNTTIILEGTVSDQYQKLRAEKVAGAYGEKVVNLLEIKNPTQVKIEARIVEINREKVKDMGLKWGFNPESAAGTFYAGQGVSNSVVGNVLGDLGTFANINVRLNALEKEGFAKILSQPNIITLSGDKANIMVGGEIPIPVAWDDDRITFEWKQYGIKLDIEPEVNNEGMINSKIKAEVSALDWNSTHRIELGANLKIPPMKVRKAETSIALSSGQTMAIGGLISSDASRDAYKVPLLADIPILGQLFRSKSFNKQETELVIFITPTIVKSEEYKPPATQAMNDFVEENPWGGEQSEQKNKSADRR